MTRPLSGSLLAALLLTSACSRPADPVAGASTSAAAPSAAAEDPAKLAERRAREAEEEKKEGNGDPNKDPLRVDPGVAVVKPEEPAVAGLIQPSSATQWYPSTTPEGVARLVREAASNAPVGISGAICHPTVLMEDNAHRICNVSPASPAFEALSQRYGRIQTSGPASAPDDKGVATVPVKLGPQGQEAGVMKVIRVEDRWYLLGI